MTFDYLQTFLDANRAGVLSKTKATTTSVSLIIEFLQWWFLKNMIFGQKQTFSKEIIVIGDVIIPIEEIPLPN